MKGVVIVAAGSSCRFGQDKLQQLLLNKTVLQTTIDLFDGLAEQIVVVGNFQTTVAGVTVVEGGTTRQQSVAKGLKALNKRCDIVAIHDGARPFVSRALIQKLFDVASKFDSAVPCLPVTDTLWKTDNGIVPQQRDKFFTVQTPQVFNFQKLLAAFEKATNTQKFYTDESALFFDFYGDVHFVEGEFSNKKVTVPADLPQFGIGAGFDVHAFGEGSGVILGGVMVPYTKKLVGHSDADVLTHAICDAVLSASGNRDIGVQFPDTDNKYLGANSLHLLAECVKLAKLNGFAVQSVSAVVICQQPKLSNFLPQMAQNLAAVLNISPQSVNISATTTEHLGALGNGDGIAAQAQALLAKKL